MDISKAIQLNSEYVEAYNNRGTFLFKPFLRSFQHIQGRKEAAVKDFTMAIEIR